MNEDDRQEEKRRPRRGANRVAPEGAGGEKVEESGGGLEDEAPRARRSRGRRSQRQSDGAGSSAVDTGNAAEFSNEKMMNERMIEDDIGEEESWDLCLVIDPVTKDEGHAQAEVEHLFTLLRDEGLTTTDPKPLDIKAGFTGKSVALVTASQEEMEQEAELMSFNKPLKLPKHVQQRYFKSEQYGRVTTAFTVARKEQFHTVPYLRGDDVLKPEDNPSKLKYFSACDRQAILEHLVEHKIRQAVKLGKLNPKTVVKLFPLHDCDGQGGIDLMWLRREWAVPFRAKRILSILQIWANPHGGTGEPLPEIRDYFGDQIAMYVAFLAFYTRWLSYPGLVGLGFQIWSWVKGHDNYGLVAYCIFICLWSVLFIKFWERKQSALSYYWFTSDLATEEKVRLEFYLALDQVDKKPQGAQQTPTPVTLTGAHFGRKEEALGGFDGVKDIADDLKALESNVRRINRKTGQIEDKYPKYIRTAKYICMLATVMLLLGAVGVAFVYFYLINIISEYWNCEDGATAGAVVHAVLIIIMGNIYRYLAQVFNNWEAHRTDTKYENHLIAKIFIFEFCNSFLSMIWICFLATYYCHSMYGLTQALIGKEDLPQEYNVEKMKTSCVYKKYGDPATCRKAARASIMQELNSKLMSLFLIRMFIGNITEVLVPMVMNYVNISLNMKEEDEEMDGEEVEEMEAEQPPNIQGEGEGGDEKQRRESGEGRERRDGRGTINPTAGGADEEEGGGQKRRSRRNEGKEDQVNEAQGVGSTAEVEDGQGGKRERRKKTGKKEGGSVGLVVAGEDFGARVALMHDEDEYSAHLYHTHDYNTLCSRSPKDEEEEDDKGAGAAGDAAAAAPHLPPQPQPTFTCTSTQEEACSGGEGGGVMVCGMAMGSKDGGEGGEGGREKKELLDPAGRGRWGRRDKKGKDQEAGGVDKEKEQEARDRGGEEEERDGRGEEEEEMPRDAHHETHTKVETNTKKNETAEKKENKSFFSFGKKRKESEEAPHQPPSPDGHAPAGGGGGGGGSGGGGGVVSGSRKEPRASGARKKQASNRRVSSLAGLRQNSREWWLQKCIIEQKMQEYGGGGDACTVDDYQELIIQFCFVTLFGVAFPLTGLLALLSNLIEMYADSHKLCYSMQRPLAKRVASIPHTWLLILKMVAVISIFTNIIIIFENSELLCNLLGLHIESSEKWIAAFVFEHIIVLCVVMFFICVPFEPKGITKLKALSQTIKNYTLSTHDQSLRSPTTTTKPPAASAFRSVLSRASLPTPPATREKAGEESERDKAGEAASKRLADLQSRGKPKKEKNEQLGEAQQIKINQSRMEGLELLLRGVPEEWTRVKRAAREAGEERERLKRKAEALVLAQELAEEQREAAWTTGKKASALHRAFEKLQITEQAQQADSQGAAEKGAQQLHKQKTEKDREKAGEESERDKVGEAASKRLADLQSRGKPKKEKNQQIGESNLVDGGKELG